MLTFPQRDSPRRNIFKGNPGWGDPCKLPASSELWKWNGFVWLPARRKGERIRRCLAKTKKTQVERTQTYINFNYSRENECILRAQYQIRNTTDPRIRSDPILWGKSATGDWRMGNGIEIPLWVFFGGVAGASRKNAINMHMRELTSPPRRCFKKESRCGAVWVMAIWIIWFPHFRRSLSTGSRQTSRF